MACVAVSNTLAREGGKGGAPTVKILKVGQLDPLAHAEHIGGRRQAVDQHPDVAGVEGAEGGGGVGRAVAVRGDGGVDISPGGHDRRQHHKPKREQGEVGDGAAEPEHLAVSDQDNGQVLEDGVDGHREELDGLGAGVDHADQEERDGEPFPRFVHLEVSERDEAHDFSGLNSQHTNGILFRVKGGTVSGGISATASESFTCMAKSIKLRLKS